MHLTWIGEQVILIPLFRCGQLTSQTGVELKYSQTTAREQEEKRAARTSSSLGDYSDFFFDNMEGELSLLLVSAVVEEVFIIFM